MDGSNGLSWRGVEKKKKKEGFLFPLLRREGGIKMRRERERRGKGVARIFHTFFRFG